ncbi:hypothetical protein FQV39_31170 (plasmid) [Bosea sp. F3-2]|nr:hypothetical protein FQV39_31170 [Bosea sp. F3-2]
MAMIARTARSSPTSPRFRAPKSRLKASSPVPRASIAGDDRPLAGLGATVLPKLALPLTRHPDLVALRIEEPIISRTLGLLERRGGHLSAAARRFKEDLMKLWAKSDS